MESWARPGRLAAKLVCLPKRTRIKFMLRGHIFLRHIQRHYMRVVTHRGGDRGASKRGKRAQAIFSKRQSCVVSAELNSNGRLLTRLSLSLCLLFLRLTSTLVIPSSTLAMHWLARARLHSGTLSASSPSGTPSSPEPWTPCSTEQKRIQRLLLFEKTW